ASGAAAIALYTALRSRAVVNVDQGPGRVTRVCAGLVRPPIGLLAGQPGTEGLPQLALEREGLTGSCPRLRSRRREVPARVQEAMPAPAGRGRLLLLLEVEREVAHQPSRLGNRADVLVLRQRVLTGAPHAANHLRRLIDVSGRDAL